MNWKIAPLNSTFMLIAILGFIIALIGIFPSYPDWGMAFAIVFALMFIASVLSTTYGDAELELKMDAPKRKKKKK
jgi:hypothetical membrane protein